MTLKNGEVDFTSEVTVNRGFSVVRMHLFSLRHVSIIMFVKIIYKFVLSTISECHMGNDQELTVSRTEAQCRVHDFRLCTLQGPLTLYWQYVMI